MDTLQVGVNEKRITALNDLIRINNDRYEGYTTAAKENRHADLDILFKDFAHKSKNYALRLTEHVVKCAGSPETGTTNSGKLYRMWMDLKAVVTRDDRKAILSSCEFGEDAALKMYDKVMNDEELSFETEVTDLLRMQRSELQMAHDKIKMLRENAKKI
ncbi:MAG: ferritin-like domain-containing protein [Chitinophagales bacterium]